jgi:DNA polymerase-3 subunit gamma/tau
VLTIPEHEVKDLMDQVAGVSFEDLHRLFQILMRGEELMARTPFPKVVLEMAVVEMARLTSLLPIDEILSRVEQLEQNLSQRGVSAGGVPPRPGEGHKGSEDKGKRMPAEDAIEPLPEPMGGELGEEAQRQWEEFLTFVKGENPILASFLSQGSPVRLDDAFLEIGFAKGSFAFDRVTERETLQSVVEIARHHFKKELQVKISSTARVKEVKATSEASAHDGETNLVSHLKKEALGNPVVQEAVEIFQGRIVEVKVKEGS